MNDKLDESIDNGEYKNLILNDKLSELKKNTNDEKSEALEEALVKIACLERTKEDFENSNLDLKNKLKLYSRAIHKLREEKKKD